MECQITERPEQDGGAGYQRHRELYWVRHATACVSGSAAVAASSGLYLLLLLLARIGSALAFLGLLVQGAAVEGGAEVGAAEDAVARPEE